MVPAGQHQFEVLARFSPDLGRGTAGFRVYLASRTIGADRDLIDHERLAFERHVERQRLAGSHRNLGEQACRVADAVYSNRIGAGRYRESGLPAFVGEQSGADGSIWVEHPYQGAWYRAGLVPYPNRNRLRSDRSGAGQEHYQGET